MHQTIITTKEEVERAVLVGVDDKSSINGWNIDSSLDELSSLAQAAGAEVVGKLSQRLSSTSSLYYIGKGKLEEVVRLREHYRYSVVICNDELSPRQQRNLEEALGVKVIDRTALILDIFARRARTREGQLQVELAQHQYLLPRLAGQWSHLERLGGGIGTRGPGESQLETDRRIIRKRIHNLQKQIEAVRRHRSLYRQKRKRSSIPVVAMVGYTNAGKSTLLNALCKSNVLTEDKLFSTLDPVTRKLVLPDKRQFLLTDTVGFINKLPTSIVASFRATLEELVEADLLVHVVDITHHNATEQHNTVEKIINELALSSKPRITVLNKVDIALEKFEDLDSLVSNLKLPDTTMIAVSALRGWGLDKLTAKILEFLDHNSNIYANNHNE